MNEEPEPMVIRILRVIRAHLALSLLVVAIVGLGVGEALVQMNSGENKTAAPIVSATPRNLITTFPSVSPPVISEEFIDLLKPLQCDSGRGGVGAHFDNDPMGGLASPEELLANEIARRPGSLLASAKWTLARKHEGSHTYVATSGTEMKGRFYLNNYGHGWVLNGYAVCGELLITDGDFVP